jgi:hypothetical protein
VGIPQSLTHLFSIEILHLIPIVGHSSPAEQCHCLQANKLLPESGQHNLFSTSFSSYIETTYPGIWTKSAFAPNKKAELPSMTLTRSYSAVRLSFCMGSATFCPYLTVGLALLFSKNVII